MNGNFRIQCWHTVKAWWSITLVCKVRLFFCSSDCSAWQAWCNYKCLQWYSSVMIRFSAPVKNVVVNFQSRVIKHPTSQTHHTCRLFDRCWLYAYLRISGTRIPHPKITLDEQHAVPLRAISHCWPGGGHTKDDLSERPWISGRWWWWLCELRGAYLERLGNGTTTGWPELISWVPWSFEQEPVSHRNKRHQWHHADFSPGPGGWLKNV